MSKEEIEAILLERRNAKLVSKIQKPFHIVPSNIALEAGAQSMSIATTQKVPRTVDTRI